jgi:N-acyl-L-homoserine lactone synthetase
MPRVIVRTAARACDREHTRRLRHEVYCREKGLLSPDQLFDVYDDRCTTLNAFQGGEPVGTVRITDSADGPLEIFEMHPELASLVPPRARLIEVSRLMVLRRCRGGLQVTLPLFRRVFAEAVARGVDGVIVSCAPGLIRYYRDLFGFRSLSTQPLRHGRLRGLTDYPMILELPSALAELTLARLPLWFAIHPLFCLRAIGLTLARKLRRGLPAPSLALDQEAA